MPAVVQAVIANHEHDANLVDECRALTKCASIIQYPCYSLSSDAVALRSALLSKFAVSHSDWWPSACRLALDTHWEAAVTENSKQPYHGLKHQIQQHSHD